jgi:hypothetical protein
VTKVVVSGFVLAALMLSFVGGTFYGEKDGQNLAQKRAEADMRFTLASIASHNSPDAVSEDAKVRLEKAQALMAEIDQLINTFGCDKWPTGAYGGPSQPVSFETPGTGATLSVLIRGSEEDPNYSWVDK